ncbi:MAG: polyprenyl synthetase family protein [Polyangiaceae bacterium]
MRGERGENATRIVADYCEYCRIAAMDEIRRLLDVQSPGGELSRLMLDYPLRPAKGLRPAIVLATARSLGAPLDAALGTAAAIELLHNAFLVHDDVEDGSLYRRGAPTLHREYGMATAMNVGDGMLALALAPLLENTTTLGLAASLEVLERVVSMVLVTVEGQEMELAYVRSGRLEENDEAPRAAYERLVVRKTAHYSFIAPVILGCIASRRPDAPQEALARYAEHLGIAFQITDDLLNLREDAEGYGKELDGDLWEGKRTLMLMHALACASPEDRARAQAVLARPRPRAATGEVAALQRLLAELHEQGHVDAHTAAVLQERASWSHDAERSVDDVAFLRGLLRKHGSLDYAQEVALEHSATAARHFERAAPSLAAGMERDFLEALIQFVVGRLR